MMSLILCMGLHVLIYLILRLIIIIYLIINGLLLVDVTESCIYSNNVEHNIECGICVEHENNNSYLYLNRIFSNGQFDF